MPAKVLYGFCEMLCKLIFISTAVLVLGEGDGSQPRRYDYCDPNLCKPGKKHIACDNDEKFSPKCGDNVFLVPMLERRKMFILGLHNQFRNEIAQGKVGNYSTASRMPVLSWDHELEYLATLNVKRCEMKHDQCRNTKKFSYVGQNLGLRHTWPHFEKYPNSIKKIVTAWFDEYKNGNQSFIDAYQKHPEGKKFGHFTAIVGDRTVKIGCACILFTDKKSKKNCFLMACNYSSTNFNNKAVYKVGEPGSNCEKGKSPRYPALCAYQEKTCIDPETGLLQ